MQGTRFQLEMQVNTLESASFNAETMAAMKKAAGALKDIHKGLYVFRPYAVFFLILTFECWRAVGQSRMWTRRLLRSRTECGMRMRLQRRFRVRTTVEWRSTQ